MNHLILITGYAGSGKDTTGKLFITRYNYVRYAFADCLKKRFSIKYGIPLYKLHCHKGKENIVTINNKEATIREHLIEYAQYKRSKNPDIWANLLHQQILYNKPHKVCITDWRQLNELEILQNLKDYKITTIRIINPNIKPQFTDDFLDNFETDFTIYNDSSINNLYNQINNIDFDLKNKLNNNYK